MTRARHATAFIALAVLQAACTSAPDPGAERDPLPNEPTASPTTTPSVELPVVIPVDPIDHQLGFSLFSGMRLAAARLLREGLRIEFREVPEGIEAAMSDEPPAVIAVDAEDVWAVRTEIEARRMPVILMGDDAYSPRQLHRYVFQTSVPIRWQARILASYLLEDRGEPDVAVIVDPEDQAWVADAFATEFASEGGSPPTIVPMDATWRRTFRTLAPSLDAVVALTSGALAASIGRHLPRLTDDPPRLLIGSTTLSPEMDALPTGSGVVLPYTWAGWADMLERVHRFREDFRVLHGRLPSGPEQEGYDAVMALGEALLKTGGEGGEPLLRELESFRDQTYSSLPLRLGPDDHVLAEQSHLGLFAVADPAGAPAGEAFGVVPWRPVMRTFTTDGEKVNFLDRDKRVFFPFWRPKRPTPKYWKSGYGIVTRRGEPPV